MTSYLLSYDLRKEENSSAYDALWSELKDWGAQRTQYSVWLVEDNSTAKEVHDHFQKLLDDNDRLWVSELVKNSTYSNAVKGTKAWIRNNPPSR